MDQEKSKAISAKLGRLNMLWPDVTTEKGCRDAIKGGAAAAGYIAFSYALSIILLLFYSMDISAAGGSAAVTIVINAFLSAAAIAIAWFIWKQRNLIAASIGLAWIAFEVVAKVATMSGGRGMIVAIFALIFSVNGVRGALAARRQAALGQSAT
jgi:hypothetical protein